MAKKQTTKKPTTTLASLKKENAHLRESLNTEVDNHQKLFKKQNQTIRELRDLVDRRGKEIMAMNNFDGSLFKRIESLESEIKLDKALSIASDELIQQLQEEVATVTSTLNNERKELREQLQSVRTQNELLSQKNAAALEFIRAHCFQ